MDKQINAIESIDNALLKLEGAALDRVNLAMEKSYQQLLKKLKGEIGNTPNIFGRERALILLDKIKQQLNILNPENPDIKRLEEELKNLIAVSDRQGLELANKQLSQYDIKIESGVGMNPDAIAIAATEGYERLLQHGQTFASNASTIVQEGIIQGWGVSRTASYLNSILNTTKASAERIVRTESMRATVNATKSQFSRNGVEYGIWIATQDRRTCPRCAERAGNIFELASIVMPLHPNDRCYISPYKKEWEDEGLIDRQWLENHHNEAIRLAGKSDSSASPWEVAGKAKQVNPEQIKVKPKEEKTPNNSVDLILDSKNKVFKKDFTDYIDVGEDEVRVEIETKKIKIKNKDIPYKDIYFVVNESFEAGTASTNGVRLGVAAIKSIKKQIKKYPDGIVLHNNPDNDDGKGHIRAKLYKSLGFGEVDENNDQWAVVVGGKIIPLSRKQLEKSIDNLQQENKIEKKQASLVNKSKSRDSRLTDIKSRIENRIEELYSEYNQKKSESGLNSDDFKQKYKDFYNKVNLSVEILQKRLNAIEQAIATDLSVKTKVERKDKSTFVRLVETKEELSTKIEKLYQQYQDTLENLGLSSREYKQSNPKEYANFIKKEQGIKRQLDNIQQVISKKEAEYKGSFPIEKKQVEKYFKKIDTLEKQLATVSSKYEKITESKYKTRTEYLEKKLESSKKIDEIKLKLQEQYQDFLEKSKRISSSEAIDLLSKIKTQGLDVPESLIEVVRLFGAVPETLKKIEKNTTGREFATDDSVSISSKTARHVVFHEVGHHFEFSDSNLKKECLRFRDNRAEEGGKLFQINKLTGNSYYSDREVGVKDKFIDHYVGKVYDDGSTEVFSMGIEKFADPLFLAKFRQDDREHFELILNYLINW